MYKHHSELLRQQLIQAATLGIENTIHDLLNRPVFYWARFQTLVIHMALR